MKSVLKSWVNIKVFVVSIFVVDCPCYNQVLPCIKVSWISLSLEIDIPMVLRRSYCLSSYDWCFVRIFDLFPVWFVELFLVAKITVFSIAKQSHELASCLMIFFWFYFWFFSYLINAISPSTTTFLLWFATFHIAFSSVSDTILSELVSCKAMSACLKTSILKPSLFGRFKAFLWVSFSFSDHNWEISILFF